MRPCFPPPHTPSCCGRTCASRWIRSRRVNLGTGGWKEEALGLVTKGTCQQGGRAAPRHPCGTPQVMGTPWLCPFPMLRAQHGPTGAVSSEPQHKEGKCSHLRTKGETEAERLKLLLRCIPGDGAGRSLGPDRQLSLILRPWWCLHQAWHPRWTPVLEWSQTAGDP